MCKSESTYFSLFELSHLLCNQFHLAPSNLFPGPLLLLLFSRLYPVLCNFSILHHLPELLKLMSIELLMPTNHFIPCLPLLLLLSIFPSIRVFSNEMALCIRWPKYYSFSFSISPSSEYSGFPLGLTGWISLQSKGLSRVFSNATVQKHQFFSAQLSLWSNSHIHT